MKTKAVVVKQNEQAPIASEIIAKAIIDIADAAKRLSNSGLKRRAIVLLISHQSGVAMRNVELVLNNLEALRDDWCTR